MNNFFLEKRAYVQYISVYCSITVHLHLSFTDLALAARLIKNIQWCYTQKVSNRMYWYLFNWQATVGWKSCCVQILCEIILLKRIFYINLFSWTWIFIYGYQFDGKNTAHTFVYLFQMRAKIWDNISDEAKDLVKKMLIHDQNDRLTAREALQHPWLSVWNLAVYFKTEN